MLDKVALAGRAGYSAIEPWNDEVTAYLQGGGTILDLRKSLDDAGLRVVSVIALHGWVTAEGEEYSRVLEDCKRRMDQAAALGSPYIVASPPKEVVELGHAARRFGELMRLGKAAGVTPSMEFLGFVDGVKSVGAALEIATKCGEANATVVADVFHMVRGGGSVNDLLSLTGKQLACFHINDLPASPDPLVQTDADRVMVGDGIAPLPAVIANLLKIGYSGPLSLELFNRSLWDRDPLEVITVGLERIKELVEAACG